MSTDRVFAYAKLNARVMPLDRGDRYEDPLQAALDVNGYAEVTGGGTIQRKDGEIEFCGIDIDLIDVEKAPQFICKCLTECGAPKGSVLEFELNGEECKIPFGEFEGLAIYFNGTDLPKEVYATCDINYVCSEINRLLGDRGEIQGDWQGPKETALYLYGQSADEMKKLIAPLMSEYALCQKARYEVIT